MKKKSLKNKLLLIITMLISIPLVISSVFYDTILKNKLDDSIVKAIEQSGKSTNMAVDKMVNELELYGKIATNNLILLESIKDNNRNSLENTMDSIYKDLSKTTNIDIFEVGDENGVVLYRAHNPKKYGDDKSELPLYKKSLIGEISVGVEYGNSGLAFRVITPLKLDDSIVGTITTGYYLNNSIVEQIKQISGMEISIFIGKKAVASTILDDNKNFESLITLNNNEILDSVLENGKIYIGEEQIQGKSFFVQYKPLITSDGNIEGVLFDGYNLEDINLLKKNMILIQIFIVIVSLGISYIISYLFIKGIAQPIEHVIENMKKVEGGNFNVKAVVNRNDELRQLANGFNNMVSVILDSMQKLDKKNLELNEMAIKDGLTNVYNQKNMYSRLKEEIKRAKKYNHSLSIIMLDIDHFKDVNDTYGHQVGDEVLVEVCKICKDNLSKIDILGRYGGEEFMVILPNNNIHNGYLVAERIRKSIEKQRYKKDLQLTISGGVVELKAENEKELVEKADNLLYKAKRSGRNRIEM